MAFPDLLSTVLRGRDLTIDEARQAMDDIVDAKARPAHGAMRSCARRTCATRSSASA